MQLWDRDESVRNCAYLRTICINAIATWRRRRNQENLLPDRPPLSVDTLRLRTAARAALPLDPNEVRDRLDAGTHDVAARIAIKSSPRRSSPRRGSPRRSSRSPGRAAPAPPRRSPSRSPRGSQICYDFKLGRCNRGSGCKFSHNLKGRSSSPKKFAPRSKSPISKESGICFYYAKAKGSCTRGDKCPIQAHQAWCSCRGHKCRRSCAC